MRKEENYKWEKNVLEAAMERLDIMFKNFDNIYFSVSGGKDSSVMVQLANKVASKIGKKFDVLFIDLEAQYRHTIEEDGYTQPIVTYYDKDKDIYIVVDGFHRYRCAKEYFHLKQIPVVTIDKSLENRMASTIRHNRARGTHQIIDMSHIVLTLTQNGWSEKEISKHLGMELDEIIRLKQITGLKEMFANHEFSKSWEEFEDNRKKRNN